MAYTWLVGLRLIFCTSHVNFHMKYFSFASDQETDEVKETLTKKNKDFVSCSLADFQKRFPKIETGTLAPYYLVAKKGKTLVGT